MDVFTQYASKSSETFQRLVGVNKGRFSIILEKYRDEIEKYKGEKMFRRQGRKSSISLPNQLLICILYLRNYDTFINLGMQFGISESYAQKRFKFTKMILLRYLDLPDELSLKDTLQTNLVAVNVSEQPIERPVKDQEKYYCGKKKHHTIKALVFVCVLTGLIKAMRFAVGKVHDFKMYKEKGFELSKEIKVLADLGFQGINKEHENAVIPYKKTKLKPLTDMQKQQNKGQDSKRVIVEHVNRDFKIFKICGNRYRGKHKNYEQNWQLIGAIVNLKKSTKNLKYATF